MQKENIGKIIRKNTGKAPADFLDTRKEYKIHNIWEGKQLLSKAINSGNYIYVMADYDVDGVTSGAIFETLFRAVGYTKYQIRFPKRFSEGYGIKPETIDEIPKGGTPLLITVDNGITSLTAIKKAKERGCQVLIVDHHRPLTQNGEMQLPDADIIIDPHVTGKCTFSHYCGAGLAYRLCSQFVKGDVKRQMCGFAALGTIADSMPLVEENRQIVIEGLKAIVSKPYRTVGTRELLRAYNMDMYLTSSDVAYYIAPAINAMSRMYDDGAKLAFQTLVYNGKDDTAERMAQNMYDTNLCRKKLCRTCMDAIIPYIENHNLDRWTPMCVYQASIPEGIIGIIAGDLSQKYQRPVLVFSDSTEDPGYYKGSARSYGGIDIHRLLSSCSRFLFKWGGHSDAAGLTILPAALPELQKGLADAYSHFGYRTCSTETETKYDLSISLEELPAVIKEIDQFRPYGCGNPDIRLLIKDFRLEYKPYASGYSKKMGQDQEHIKFFGRDIDAIAYGMASKYEKIGEPLELGLICTVDKNHYISHKNGKLIIKDVLLCSDIFSAEKPAARTDMWAALERLANEKRIQKC